ncbi:stage V sporulation protein T [Pueribacillus theae]|uniref:Stage V sporulation protein T n=1 Tax=Pueribacillus theae TaxID=2171751 RepID=A0A2U1K4Q0_9BACI|nr:stage V sporulation protein T [Pueribacillus theae]PWA12129.1 stage V sporulation protein T [Pueribacillus theae]
MKATGIVRRIDDLGRVVIPKEIRRTLRIREGDPLEIFVDRDGEVILKKYSPISELGDFAKEYSESLSEHSGHTVLISDRDTFIAVSGGSKKEHLNKALGSSVEQSMSERKTVLQSEGSAEIIEGTDYEGAFVIAPIIANGDPIGAVVMLAKEGDTLSEVEKKLSETAAGFLARQMEQ